MGMFSGLCDEQSEVFLGKINKIEAVIESPKYSDFPLLFLRYDIDRMQLKLNHGPYISFAKPDRSCSPHSTYYVAEKHIFNNINDAIAFADSTWKRYNGEQ